MTRREKFLDLIKDEMFFQEEITLREITDELFIEWMTHGGFHLGAAFHYFTLFFGYTGKCKKGEKTT